MSAPTELPIWADAPTDPVPGLPGNIHPIAEPSDAVKHQGWVGERPPLNVFNWWMNLVYQWASWLWGNVGITLGRSACNPLTALCLGIPHRNVCARNISIGIPTYKAVLALDFLWVVASNANTLIKINPATNAVIASWSGFNFPSAIVFDGTYIWVIESDIMGTPAGNLKKINPATGAVILSISVGGTPDGGCFDGTNIWTGDASGTTIKKINVTTGAVGSPISGFSGPTDFAFDGTYVWVCNVETNTVSKVDPVAGTIVATVTVGSTPQWMAFDGNYIWVSNYSGSVSKIDPIADTVVSTVSFEVGDYVAGLAFDGRFIWLALGGTGKVARIDPLANAVTHTITLDAATPQPHGLTFDGYHIWVSQVGSNYMQKIPVI